jgi:hypothetical protein
MNHRNRESFSTVRVVRVGPSHLSQIERLQLWLGLGDPGGLGRNPHMCGRVILCAHMCERLTQTTQTTQTTEYN